MIYSKSACFLADFRLLSSDIMPLGAAFWLNSSLVTWLLTILGRLAFLVVFSSRSSTNSSVAWVNTLIGLALLGASSSSSFSISEWLWLY